MDLEEEVKASKGRLKTPFSRLMSAEMALSEMQASEERSAQTLQQQEERNRLREATTLREKDMFDLLSRLGYCDASQTDRATKKHMECFMKENPTEFVGVSKVGTRSTLVEKILSAMARNDVRDELEKHIWVVKGVERDE